MWYPDNQLRKKLDLCMQKRPMQESNKNTKYVLTITYIC